MSCDGWRERILDAMVDGSPVPDGDVLRKHVDACRSCSAWERDVRTLWNDLPEAAALPDPRRGVEELRRRVAREFPAETRPARRTSAGIWFGRLAAAIALMAAGAAAGRYFAPMPAVSDRSDAEDRATDDADDELPRFVLLIYAVPGDDQASDEVGPWARGLFREGVVVDGAGLASGAAWAGPATGARSGQPLTHYIQIRARDLEHARQIAATVPTTRRGGIVEVRPLN